MKETNMEHFRGEIESIVNAEYCEFVPAVVDGRPAPCDNSVSCLQCEFNDHDGTNECSVSFIKWLMSEYKEEPVLTQREKHFVEFVQTGYIARDADDGFIYWIEEKPSKGSNYWIRRSRCTKISAYSNELFPFITWEDEEPWSIERLRELKVQDAD